MTDTPPTIPWGRLPAVTTFAAYETGIDDARRAHLDRVQASLRNSYSAAGVDVSNPTAVFVLLVFLDWLDGATRHDEAAGMLSRDEATAILATIRVMAMVLARWLPTEARP